MQKQPLPKLAATITGMCMSQVLNVCLIGSLERWLSAGHNPLAHPCFITPPWSSTLWSNLKYSQLPSKPLLADFSTRHVPRHICSGYFNIFFISHCKLAPICCSNGFHILIMSQHYKSWFHSHLSFKYICFFLAAPSHIHMFFCHLPVKKQIVYSLKYQIII